MNLVNLTRNTIHIYDESGDRVLFSIPTDVPDADATADMVRVDLVEDEQTGFEVPIVRHEFHSPVDVPAPEDDTLFIVGYHVLQALDGDRDDVVAPDTSRGSAVKDKRGRIVGVRRFRVL